MQSQNITQQLQNSNSSNQIFHHPPSFHGGRQQKSTDKNDVIIDLLKQLNNQLQNKTIETPSLQSAGPQVPNILHYSDQTSSSSNELDDMLLNIHKYNKLVQQIQKQNNNNESQTYDLICQFDCHDQFCI